MPWKLAGLLYIAGALLAALAAQTLEVDAYCLVERVIDGDTIRCRVERILDPSLGVVEGETYSVRLADIDAPELRPSPEPGSREALGLLSSLVLGERVALDIDDLRVTDKYGRLVAIVIAYYNETHGVNANRLLVSVGLAETWEHENEWILGETPLYIEWSALNVGVEEASYTKTISGASRPLLAVTPTLLILLLFLVWRLRGR
ncbi:MAG: thermonuclease family protein [Desulfurococcales archaeon]|nr:thermonuclease family protein [Desulfurococcales archaeon]